MSWTRKICVPLAMHRPRVPPIPALASVLLLGSLTLAGCSQTDPYQRSGTWKPSGVNSANIASMVANPADLSRGRGETAGTVRSATTAVDRLWRGPAPAPTAAPSASGALLGGGARPGSEAPR